MSWEIREFEPDLWPALEKLFGPNGACGGCWCIWWRLEKGERWPTVKGARAKRRMKALVKSGKAKGLLAFDRDQPVGWLALGPRTEFSRLDRAPSLACNDAKRVLEGYPVSPKNRGGRIPAAFAYTGTVAMFGGAGFKPAVKKDRGKRRVRLEL